MPVNVIVCVWPLTEQVILKFPKNTGDFTILIPINRAPLRSSIPYPLAYICSYHQLSPTHVCRKVAVMTMRHKSTGKEELPLGFIHKPCGQLRGGGGVSQMTIS